jgi:hypothetical protein
MPLQKLGTKQYYLGIFFKVSNTFTYVNRLLKTIHIKKCLGIKLSVVIPNEKKEKRSENHNSNVAILASTVQVF